MKSFASVIVTFRGGPQDGETILMQPMPGVGPPQHFAYFTGKQPYNVGVYELWPPMPTWPEAGSGRLVERDGFRVEDAVAVSAHWSGAAKFEYQPLKEKAQ